MALKDAYRNPVTSPSRAAVDAYDSGVRTLLGFGASIEQRVAKRPNPGRHWLEARA